MDKAAAASEAREEAIEALRALAQHLIPGLKDDGLAGLAALAHLNQGLRLSKAPRMRNAGDARRSLKPIELYPSIRRRPLSAAGSSSSREVLSQQTIPPNRATSAPHNRGRPWRLPELDRSTRSDSIGAPWAHQDVFRSSHCDGTTREFLDTNFGRQRRSRNISAPSLKPRHKLPPLHFSGHPKYPDQPPARHTTQSPHPTAMLLAPSKRFCTASLGSPSIPAGTNTPDLNAKSGLCSVWPLSSSASAAAVCGPPGRAKPTPAPVVDQEPQDSGWCEDSDVKDEGDDEGVDSLLQWVEDLDLENLGDDVDELNLN